MFVTPSWALQFLDWAVDGKTPKADGQDACPVVASATADVHEEHDDDGGEEEDQLQEEEDEDDDDEEEEEEEEEEVIPAAEPTRHNQQAGPRTSKQGLYPKRYKKEVSNCTLELACW